jgi:hypothetical protein
VRVSPTHQERKKENKENKEKRRSNGGKLVGVILISARFVSRDTERERGGGDDEATVLFSVVISARFSECHERKKEK